VLLNEKELFVSDILDDFPTLQHQNAGGPPEILEAILRSLTYMDGVQTANEVL
jgi:hypothetical protein